MARLPVTPPRPDAAPTGVLRTPTGVVVPILGHYDGGRGRWVRTPCFRIDAVPSGRVLTPNPDVVLDPGHGGGERGAVSIDGLTESSVNLAVAQRVERQLEQLGYTVELTRTTDTWMTIRTRAEVVRALRPTVAVSIHHNAGGSGTSDQPGTQVFAQRESDTSKSLARALHDRISAGFTPLSDEWRDNPDRGVGHTRSQDDPTKDGYGFLRFTAPIPAALTEGAYTDLPQEARMLGSETGQMAEADAIANALTNVLGPPQPPKPPQPRPLLGPSAGPSMPAKGAETNDAVRTSGPEPFPVGPPTDQAACVEPSLR